MKTTNQYLDAAKTTLRLDSDRALCRALGWRETTCQNYRRQITCLNNDHAAQIATLLHMNPLAVIADMEVERAKDEKQRLYWADIAKKFAGVAASSAWLYILVALCNDPSSQAIANSWNSNEINGLSAIWGVAVYIMLNNKSGPTLT